jgi:DNA-binding SARP family transcriptional activator
MTRMNGVSNLSFQLFGPLAVADGDRALGPRDFPGVKPKQVLEILLLSRGHPVPKDRLAESLWPETMPRDIAATLEVYVSKLRRCLAPDGRTGHELVVTEPEAYRFATERASVDVDRFDTLVQRASRVGGTTARRHLDDALALVRGDLLEDEPYAEWVQAAREQYRGRVLQARLDAARAALAEGDFREALVHAEAAIVLDDYSESAYRFAILASYALFGQSDALRVFERCRRILADNLDAEPTADTGELAEAVRRREAPESLLPGPLPELLSMVPANSPSKVPMIDRVAELARIEELVARSVRGSCSFIVLEGEAGVGKSRLIEEVLARFPDVRVGRARCAELERRLPFAALATALRDAFSDIAIHPRSFPGLGKILPELRYGRGGRRLSQAGALESLVDLVRSHGPVVLVLDDLHWADSSTIMALGYLQRRCHDVPLALLTALRPEELAPAHSTRRLEPTARIPLEPLGAADLEAAGMAHLYDRTGGHPLFLSLALTEGVGEEVSPELTELIVHRCRVEGGTAYRLLTSASVLEQPFEPRVLALMLGIDFAQAAEELERLCQRKLLVEDALRYRFRIELVRDVLATSLSPVRRELLRQRSAAAREFVMRTQSFGTASGNGNGNGNGNGKVTPTVVELRELPQDDTVYDSRAAS